jgi:hypothetical protein
MASASQIRESVSSYLQHGDADKFILEFSALSYNIHRHGNPEAIRVANEIESKLADLRGGFISKSVFLESLGDLVKPSANNYVVMYLDCSGSVNQRAVLENSSLEWAGSFGTSLGVGYGSAIPVR